MKFKREKSTFECPRCGIRCMKGVETCPECKLVFSRLALATNKDAKKKLLRHDKDFIIYTNKLPSDVSFIKLMLLTIFVGLFGGHCFYVGRYWRGGLLLTNSIILICCSVFNEFLFKIDDGRFIAMIATICGLIMMVWAYDLVIVMMKKFKVPVAIDLETGVISEGE